ncbi:MAG TPA: molybdate ABC transporter substrate-binding protein [Candidatus Sulfotelmatobacter sp.]|nr:molybdate ABC transporter substrate-binding protein [Candidatus Sulfotelmatobacter sp.]
MTRVTLLRPLASVARLLLVSLVLLGLHGGAPASAQQPNIVVFAAASLKNALDEINGLYQIQKGVVAKTSYAASSTLAKQIEAAAPADVFISADLDWMDYLAKRDLIKPETRANLLSNAIVLIGPAAGAPQLTIAPHFPLAQALGDRRLAMADPASVPAGKYGKAALEALGVWTSVAGKVAPAENVRAALLLVSRGETPLGIVYATDAAADPGVRIVGTFPANTHPPIVYPVAVTRHAPHAGAAADYVAFLKSPAARPAFEKQGFTLIE